ncbi:glycosyltransferase [Dawidia soli]|uniref:Glycosyltransferase n=1 Tax=Dawidia soli TaxID=2782352 RepID=A0AAP2DCS4_9BACT|nr:glycosyltransferase family 2 protein [Dawidia soli]MBT1688365.1 glycosyltransferase [Dawidia soli]
MLVLEIILLVYFGFVVFHNFFFSAISFIYREDGFYKGPVNKHSRIAVLIPSYKEDGVIISTAELAVRHNYPPEAFTVFVIADSLQPATVQALRQTGATVFEVSFEKSTKVRALQYALARMEGYDIAVVLDADNVMKEGFLAKVNHAFNNGFRNLQGRRVAKNSDTPMAYLDSISEAINNQIFRKGYNAVGLSSSLIGSAMAFPFQPFRDNINAMDSVGGFDRELHLRLLAQKQRIYYLESAEVYDEKTRQAEAFSNQRRRWLSSQFVYLQRNFGKGVRQLLKGDFVFFEASVLSNLLLPRILTLGCLPILVILFTLLRHYLVLGYAWTWAYAILYVAALVIAVPAKYFDRKLFAAVASLPKAFALMFLNLFRLKNANKKFIHTPHSTTTVESKK